MININNQARFKKTNKSLIRLEMLYPKCISRNTWPYQCKTNVFRKHFPKQQEIDALLKDLRKRVLHNLMVNLDTKDLIEEYEKSLRYREIYKYIADGRLAGNALKQKKIAGEAANYVVVNDLLFKITQHKESGKWVYNLPLVITRKN